MDKEMITKDNLPSKCRPCEGKVAALAKEAVDKLIASYPEWQLVEDKKIAKDFRFNDFKETKKFLDRVADIAEEQGHHPTMTISYKRLKITLTTHAASGLTENDFIMAKLIDKAGEQE